jgi:hypothetical protein
MPSDILENLPVAETAMGTPVHAQEGTSSEYVTAEYE